MTKEEKEAFHKECVAESGVSEDTVKKAMTDGEFVDEPKFKAHLLCFGKKVGFQNDAGELQKDVIKAKLSTVVSDEAVVEKMIECAVQKSTPEDTAFETAKCMHAFKKEIV